MIATRRLNMDNPKMGNQFPNVEMIIHQHTIWKNNSSHSLMDTTMALRGIIDAEKFYKPKNVYW